MKNGRICSVEYLHQTTDEKRIAESMELFQAKGLPMGAEGFEVWDHTRFVHRFVLDNASATPAGDGLKGGESWLERLARKLTFKRALLASAGHPPRARAHA
jgi:hypothetical protein